MNKHILVLATALFAFGCNDKAGDSGDTSGTTADGGTDGGTTLPADLVLDCAWDGVGLTVDLTNGDAAGYNLGLAETDCGGECWTGEDCFDGYTASDGTVYNFCHPMASTGGFLESVDSFALVVEGSATIHRADLNNTYYLEEIATGDCWTFGYDTSYYGGIGCADAGGGCTGE